MLVAWIVIMVKGGHKVGCSGDIEWAAVVTWSGVLR